MFDQVTTNFLQRMKFSPRSYIRPRDQRHKIQQSLAHTITCRGIGLHSGQEIKMTRIPLRPIVVLPFIAVTLKPTNRAF